MSAEAALRVLLISPWRMDELVSGDNVITDLLMAHPPDGVAMTHQAQAMAAGQLRRAAWGRAWLASLAMHSRPPAGVAAPWRYAGQPPWWVRALGKLKGGDRPDVDVQWLAATESPAPWDLVHAHIVPVGLRGALRDVPLVLGHHSGNLDLLRHYVGLSDHHCFRLGRRDAAWLKRLGADHDSWAWERAQLVVVSSHHAAALHRECGVPEAKLRVVPQGLEDPGEPAPWPQHEGCRFAFVGQDFLRKGGAEVLTAFQQLRLGDPRVGLAVVSAAPEAEAAKGSPGVRWWARLPREEVLGSVLPQAEVVLLPSHAEGYGLAAVEAMALGRPVIASRVGALPELVGEGPDAAGLLVPPGDASALARAMSELAFDPARRQALGAAARARFLARFAMPVAQAQLGAVYREAWRGRA